MFFRLTYLLPKIEVLSSSGCLELNVNVTALEVLEQLTRTKENRKTH